MRWLVMVAAIVGCSANDDTPAPQVSSVTPNHAASGTIVLVSGSYFCHQLPTEDPLQCAHTGAVEFGTAAGNASQYTDTSIMVEVPGGAGPVSVIVDVAGERSNAVAFTIE